MPGRLILTLSAIILFISGGAALFAGDEVARLLDPGTSPATGVMTQLVGSGLFGFAVQNWMSRGARIGGIYARPLGIANLLLFTTAALTLARAVASQEVSRPAIGACAAFAILAVSFGWLVFAHDPVAAARNGLG